MEESLDTVAEILYFLTLAHPLITMPLVWKFSKGSKWIRILEGVLLSLLISLFLGIFGMTILFRNGMGPG